MKNLRLIYLVLSLLIITSPVVAQMFSTDNYLPTVQNAANLDVPTDKKTAEASVNTSIEATLPFAPNISASPNNIDSLNSSSEDIFIPEDELYRLETPTIDGTKRGGQAFVEVDEQGRLKKADNIFLYYDNFKIINYFGNQSGCNVRFNILSNLDRKINQLDVKLVWPGITTTLSFSDVLPNTQNYYNYSLLGEGCYTMDKYPNIIVNRCRVRGMTASECANKIIWLSK